NHARTRSPCSCSSINSITCRRSLVRVAVATAAGNAQPGHDCPGQMSAGLTHRLALWRPVGHAGRDGRRTGDSVAQGAQLARRGYRKARHVRPTVTFEVDAGAILLDAHRTGIAKRDAG